jgi:hypothetical protein
MFETSVKAMDDVTIMFQKWIDETKHYHADRRVIAEQRMKQSNQTINAKDVAPVERLRALMVNVIESEALLAEKRELTLLYALSTFSLSVRMFQEDVAYEINLLKAKTVSHGSTLEEQQKHEKMQSDLQKMKRTIGREWKPLMKKLKEAIDERRRFLEENR